jgi:hypothetical protein
MLLQVLYRWRAEASADGQTGVAIAILPILSRLHHCDARI